MTERYIIDDAGTLIDIETRNTYDYVNEVCELLNELATKCSQLKKENEQLKKQLREEQCRTTPITLTTQISDDDFKKIELMLKKYFGDLE